MRIGILSDTHDLLRPGVMHTLDGCDAILHGQGFSQSFLGEPTQVQDRLWLRRVTVLLVVLSLLLGGGVGVYKYLHPPVVPIEEEIEVLPEDTVTIADEYLQQTVRSAVGGGAITEEAVAAIETLTLSRLPESLDDLDLLPNLSTLILTEEAAKTAPELPDLYERYTLILTGGDAQ